MATRSGSRAARSRSRTVIESGIADEPLHQPLSEPAAQARRREAAPLELIRDQRPVTVQHSEPFEAVDPISAATIRDILQRYVAGGGTVVFSSHVLELVERLCTHVAILAEGKIKAVGTLDEVRAGRSLEDMPASTREVDGQPLREADERQVAEGSAPAA